MPETRLIRWRWPDTPEELVREQERLASLHPPPWVPRPDDVPRLCACAVVFGRAGADSMGWAGAVVEYRSEVVDRASLIARLDIPYRPGQLAMREGPVLESVVRCLRERPERPEVLLVAATGKDHPRRAGLALHIGQILDLPTVGVTDAPLLATGDEPGREWMSKAPLRIGKEVVGYRVRTRKGAKPVVAHAAWRTSPEVAARVVLEATAQARWPEAMREARRLARDMRRQMTG